MFETRTPPRGKRPLVWIVDDSPTEALIAERSLGANYDFEKFTDGAVVVERLAAGTRQPDLVLLDWVMPGMGGDEVCRFLRTHHRTLELPIILITASVDTADVAHGLAIGANDYVARPFATSELRARVDSAIRAKLVTDLARREQQRLFTINRLARALFEAGTDIDRILDELAASLVVSICDGCSILLLPGSVRAAPVARHTAEPSGASLAAIATLTDPVVHQFASSDEARAKLASGYGAYIDRFGLRSLAILPIPRQDPIRGIVTVTRDGASDAFDADDLTTIETCIEYTGLAIESAVRFDANQKVTIALTRSNQDLDRFAYVASHDLRAPLRGIANLATWIEEDLGEPGPGQSREHLRLLRSRVDRMESLIDGILTYARAGRVELAQVQVDIRALLRETIDLIAPPAHVTVVLGPTMPVLVTDRSPLQQCFSNLIGNAIKHGRREGAVIEVGCEPNEDGWTFWVTDNGPGIAPEYQARVFELFQTLAPRDEVEGSGIGLAVVKRLVEARGGEVTVTSVVGAGARFAFTWPAIQPG